MTNPIPVGTTHVLPTDPEAYSLSPLYMKWGHDFVGPESGTSYSCWYHWHRGAWHKDYGFCDRHNRLQTVEQYKRKT